MLELPIRRTNQPSNVLLKFYSFLLFFLFCVLLFRTSTEHSTEYRVICTKNYLFNLPRALTVSAWSLLYQSTLLISTFSKTQSNKRKGNTLMNNVPLVLCKVRLAIVSNQSSTVFGGVNMLRFLICTRTSRLEIVEWKVCRFATQFSTRYPQDLYKWWCCPHWCHVSLSHSNTVQQIHIICWLFWEKRVCKFWTR